MDSRLTKVAVVNYRSLANVSLELGAVNVFFGPNGSGKSTFLDAIWFFRGCAVRGVELATGERSHGINIRYDGAAPEEQISIALSTPGARYELRFGLSAGRIEPFAGEHLESYQNEVLIDRGVGTAKAQFQHRGTNERSIVNLREPDKLSLGRFLDFDGSVWEAEECDQMLRAISYYQCRYFNFFSIKHKGSDAGHEYRLYSRGENLWSVLRNLQSRTRVDERFATIMHFMAEAFPTFDGIALEPTSADTVSCEFLEKGRQNPIKVTGVSDGQIALLLVLTALFCGHMPRESLVILDEPDLSLHPWALAVLGKAVQHAAEIGRRQVILATHSPVLLSQFDTKDIIATEIAAGRTCFRRVSEMQDIQDLLEKYAAGSLYMAQMIGGQSKPKDPEPPV